MWATSRPRGEASWQSIHARVAMSLLPAVRSVLAAHGADVDESTAEEIAVTLELEHLGSALDVSDAVGHLLGDENIATLAAALFDGIRGRTKRPRIVALAPTAAGGPSAIDMLAWKREYMSDEQRFVLPYKHALDGSQTLVLRQAAFGPEGFASTIWDSSIVLSRYLELHRHRYANSRAIELGAGCGLPGIVLRALGAEVVLTDLEDNLPLLEHNVQENVAGSGATARVAALRWGEALPEAVSRSAPYDLIVAADVLYVHDGVAPLVQTLAALANAQTEILLAAGRNRQAADAFFAAASEAFTISTIDPSELHPTYQSEDVTVWRLQLRGSVSKQQRDLTIDGVRYEVDEGGAMSRPLADGTSGPVVGRMDGEGGIVVDESAWAGEWVTELLTATKPPAGAADAADAAETAMPPDVRDAIARGHVAEWRNAISPSLLHDCRSELANLDAAGLLHRKNHAQHADTRTDRVAYLAIDGHTPPGRAAGDECGEEEEDDDDEEEGAEQPRCPPSLRRLFALLERWGSSLGEAVGVRSLLTPRLGMVATYGSGGESHGYVRHLDNERDEVSAQSSGYRNFRALTAIAYLNEPEWTRADGGVLRCYEPLPPSAGAVGGADSAAVASDAQLPMEVVPCGGTVVFFDSRRVPHEVLPSRRSRSAASLWFVTGDLLQPTSAPPPRRRRARSEPEPARSSSAQHQSSSITASWTTSASTQSLFGGSGSEAAETPSGFSFGF